MAEEPIYIVSIEMSSPNRIVQTTELDEFKTQTRYFYDKVTRRKIGAIRARYKNPQYDSCLKVFTLYVCKESVRTRISEVVTQADREMKDIDPGLYARVVFFPLSRDAIRESEMYDQLTSAIRTQVYGSIFDRLNEVTKKGSIPKKSVNALMRMCDELRDLNVLDDKEIADRIESIRTNIEKRMFAPVLAELKEQVDALNSPFAYLEMDEPKKVVPTTGTKGSLFAGLEPDDPDAGDHPRSSAPGEFTKENTFRGLDQWVHDPDGCGAFNAYMNAMQREFNHERDGV